MLTENAIKVLERRYLIKDNEKKIIETPDELFRRVAKHVASGYVENKVLMDWDRPFTQDALESYFYEGMKNLHWLPNTPCLMNAGKPKGQLSACFVLPVGDSMEEIFDAVKWAAMIHKTGGGTGFSFSRLRPNGSMVGSTHGTASGPVSFMKVFNAATEAVKQGGTRRGANMGILRVDHPDILEFIDCKQDLTQVTNFNISVGITDEFMQALKEKRDYVLINPRTKKQWQNNNGDFETLNAEFVFNKIIENAWKTGEPGCIFLDRVNELNPGKNHETIEATNPCIAKGSLVATSNGLKLIEDIKEQDYIKTISDCLKVKTIEFHKNLDVYKIILSDGSFIRATKSHQFHAIKKNTNNHKVYSEIELQDLEIGDTIRIAPMCLPKNIIEDKPNGCTDKNYGLLLGILLGDGCITQKSINKGVVKIASNKTETEWNKKIHEIVSSVVNEPYCHFDEDKKSNSCNLSYQSKIGLSNIVKKSKLPLVESPYKDIPLDYINSNEEFLSGIIDGLVSTDGNINLKGSYPSIRIKSTSQNMLINVRRILLMFGIHGRIYNCGKTESEINGRKIHSNFDRYEIHITGGGIKVFAEKIGISHPDKKKRLDKLIRYYGNTGGTWQARIIDIIPDGKEDVYDLYEPITDTWIVDGIVNRGCGEIPLPPFDVCNLLSINLSNAIKNGKLQGEWLRDRVRIATIFLDSMINVNSFVIPEIQEQVLKSRRIGLGVMGFADALAKMSIEYGSDESLDFADSMMKYIQEIATETSEELGKAHGCVYDLNRRNTTVTMIAPTGTISIIAGCSSGIEPFYAIAYTRNVMEGTRLLEVNPYFEKIAKKRGFYSKELMEKIANCNSIQHMEEIPEDVRKIFKTASDISPEIHVRMQAVFQKYCDSAVSKTINLPYESTKEDVDKAYRLAFDLKCKGVTVYRDGSRPGQVLSTGATPEEARNTEQIGAFGIVKKELAHPTKDELLKELDSNPFNPHASMYYKDEKFSTEYKCEFKSTTQPRPVRVYGYTEKIKTGYGNLYVTINSINDKPFEVFSSIGKSGFSMMADTEGICRMISLGLRNNIPIEEIIEQLQGIGGSQPIIGQNGTVYSIPDAIAKVLNNIEPSNGKLRAEFDISREKCPDCYSDLSHGEGCVKCLGCGYSKC